MTKAMEQQYRSREEQEQAQYIRVSLTLAEYIADYINRELADDVVDESLILDALDTWAAAHFSIWKGE
jgi:hypothetical protein